MLGSQLAGLEAPLDIEIDAVTTEAGGPLIEVESVATGLLRKWLLEDNGSSYLR
jgi:hypothetical protein